MLEKRIKLRKSVENILHGKHDSILFLAIDASKIYDRKKNNNTKFAFDKTQIASAPKNHEQYKTQTILNCSIYHYCSKYNH